METVFYLLIWSLLAGFIGSLIGLGGGIILTPILTIIFNVDIKYAIGSSIIAVIATSSGSAISYIKEGIANIKLGLFLEIFTTLGGIIGALLSGIFSSRILYLFFSIILLNSFYGMLKKSGLIRKKSLVIQDIVEDKYEEKYKFSTSYYDKAENRVIPYKVTNVKKGSIVMLAAGLASGLLGIGSGAFKVIALDDYMKLPLKVSTATSNFMMGVTACSSALIYFFIGMVNPLIAGPVAIGTLLGSRIGSIVMQNISSFYIRIIFLPVLFITIINMLLKGLGVLS